MTELEALHDEYIELYLAQEFDNITCSLSTLKSRNIRMGEIQETVSPDIIEMWEEEIEGIIEDEDEEDDIVTKMETIADVIKSQKYL